MAVNLEQGVEYVTTEQLEISGELLPDAWVFMVDLQKGKPYRMKMKDFLSNASEVDMSIDGGSFI